ncbi:ATP-binding protein [Paenibacillus xylaniclasticus]|uniref:ATP-binding protein n=1 Tax=Paenibacillus xylaniclasticus TaxID=588083 RepID=UPI000FDC3E8C|nr:MULTISPECIES: ATP-binding protein [Paenibacillus]GFN32848.1 hypothetical protein PCURB6_31080 [Paenibacillus curdlanolyticus]
MSIKAKLSLVISAVVAVILTLNIIIFYGAANRHLQKDAEQNMLNIANQIQVSVQVSEAAQRRIEQAIAEKLRAAAIAAKARLDPDAANVSNEQLKALSRELDIDDISLWQQTEDDIVVVKSSNPEELGLGSKTMGYWYDAFQQLFASCNTTVTEGQRLEHFWSGPINYATSNPSHINKWGYYYDGTTNYLINPLVDAKSLISFDQQNGTEKIIHHLKATYPELLEITGIDPRYFGKDPILKFKKGELVHNLDVRAIKFGQYTLKDEDDTVRVQQAIDTGQPITVKTTVENKRVLKILYPVQGEHQPYVIHVQFDRDFIPHSLVWQILQHAVISLTLLLLTIVLSYWLSGRLLRPLQLILRKVNDMAKGDFSTPIPEHNKDELGQLAADVNNLGASIVQYTDDLKSTMDELRSTKVFLQSFFDHTSDAIHVLDAERIVVQANQAFENIYGWTVQEVIGKPLNNIPAEWEYERQMFVDVITHGKPITNYETTRYTKDGRQINVSVTASPIHDQDGRAIAIACISRDITARKQTEERLRRSEKLSVVGQLAAGVAHEIRNPLTTLRGFIQLASSRGTLSPDHIDIMIAELDRINMIVSEFLILSKPQKLQYVPVDVNQLMHETLLLLESEAAVNDITFDVSLEPSLPSLSCEPNQLRQVFLNLIKNGIQASPSGASLIIRTSAVSYRDSGTDAATCIEIADQGCGIPPEDLARLGEPFFTRKPDGHGLGLMVCQQIITQHQGTLQFQSTVGQGTRAIIVLPNQHYSKTNPPGTTAV